MVGAFVVAFVGIGWYFQWYQIERQPSADGTQRLQVDIQTKRIIEDGKTALERSSEFIHDLRKGDEKNQRLLAPASLPGPTIPTQSTNSVKVDTSVKAEEPQRRFPNLFPLRKTETQPPVLPTDPFYNKSK